MASLLTLTSSRPRRTLTPGEVLVRQGEAGGALYVLESGLLRVERDGVAIATLAQPGTLIGEMGVLLGTNASATVKAESEVLLRVVDDALAQLQADPELSFRVAALLAQRLDATSAMLVGLSREHTGKPAEQGLLSRILSALAVPTGGAPVDIVQRNDMFGDAGDRSRE